MTTATQPQRGRPAFAGWMLRAMREAHHISLRNLAAQAGTSPSHLSRVETGERSLSPELEARICDVIASLPSPGRSA